LSEQRLPRASLVEGLRFTAQALLPNLLQGLFRRRRRATAAATKVNVDKHAVGLIAGLRRSHGRGPVWVRAGGDQALLALDTDDVRRVLEGSPEPFAADPDAKRRGMSHFQPDALTISRGQLWRNRRRFTEAVLDTGKPLHRLADRLRAVTAEEAERLLAASARADSQLRWDPFNDAVRRITRRVILGDAAAEDEAVSDLLATLMDEANGLPKERSEHFEPFMAKLESYAAAAEPGSLVGLFGEAPSDAETETVGQIPHWMFALGDTLAINAYRALALVVSHPRQGAKVSEEIASAGDGLGSASGVASLAYLEACLQEAMRLWPTTALLSREAVAETEWEGEQVPAGGQLLISNTFNHRDPERHEFADRFEPEVWTNGDAAQDWSFNHFSHGPQGCPGAGIALFVGKALLADLLSRRRIRLLEPSLDPERPLPHMLDFFSLRFGVEPKA
jgi:cytochrome P450